MNSPAAFAILEAGLAVQRDQGVPLGRALDTLNSVMAFVAGHTLAEAGQTPGHEETSPAQGAPGVPAAPDVDPARYPNFAEALVTGVGLDFDSRFDETLGILTGGFAAAGQPLTGDG